MSSERGEREREGERGRRRNREQVGEEGLKERHKKNTISVLDARDFVLDKLQEPLELALGLGATVADSNDPAQVVVASGRAFD